MTTHSLSRSEFEPPQPLPERTELPADESLQSLRLGSLNGRSSLPSAPAEQPKSSSLPYLAALFLVVAIVAGLAGYTSVVDLRSIGVAGPTISAVGIAELARFVCLAAAALFVITVAAFILRRL